MPENPQTAPADDQTSVAWKRVSTALAVLALAAVIGPVLADPLMSSSEHAPREREQRREKPAAESEADEEEAEEESARPAPTLNSSGGPRSGGSSGTSSSDVIACNRAAAVARRHTEAPQHQGLSKALDAAGGGLLGANARLILAGISATGFSGPMTIATCTFLAPGVPPSPGDFVIDVVDAATPDFQPVEPTVSVSAITPEAP